VTLADINGFNKEQFVQALGEIFDGGAWVAERAWRKRPFLSFDDLSTKLIQEVQSASADQQLTLLHSATVPASAGLNDLLGKYRKKFGYPFIYAVKDGDEAAVNEALNRRLKSPPEQEFQVALGNVFRIARFRLEDIVTPAQQLQ
jgi:2-oxo-4-hydroxy-4-carboxy--5-ureidoimidazoline (OHCU) decarboxylase